MSFMNQSGFQRVYNFIFSSEWSGVRYNKIPITAGMMSKSNLKKKNPYLCDSQSMQNGFFIIIIIIIIILFFAFYK